MNFELHVLSTLHRMEGRQVGFQEHVVRTLDSHSQILRQHARRITQSESKNARNKKDGGLWQDMAIQLWSKIIVAAILLGLATFSNIAPETTARLLQNLFGK